MAMPASEIEALIKAHFGPLTNPSSERPRPPASARSRRRGRTRAPPHAGESGIAERMLCADFSYSYGRRRRWQMRRSNAIQSDVSGV